MRIVAQIAKEFSVEYPIYAGNSQQTQTQFQQPKPVLFPNGFGNNPGIQQQGTFVQQGMNPQPQNVNTNINYNNVSPFPNTGNKNPKDQLLGPLKSRCKHYLKITNV